jgi:hypothetical protein
VSASPQSQAQEEVIARGERKGQGRGAVQAVRGLRRYHGGGRRRRRERGAVRLEAGTEPDGLRDRRLHHGGERWRLESRAVRPPQGIRGALARARRESVAQRLHIVLSDIELLRPLTTRALAAGTLPTISCVVCNWYVGARETACAVARYAYWRGTNKRSALPSQGNPLQVFVLQGRAGVLRKPARLAQMIQEGGLGQGLATIRHG